MKVEISTGSATSATITGTTTPDDVIGQIQSGVWAKKISALRAATGDAADDIKKRLPAVLWSGTFSTRSKNGLIQHSGLLCADIDKIPERVGELHDLARTDQHAVAAFVSPSGTGLKIVFRVPPDASLHSQSFNSVRSHVASFYGVPVDEAAKDVSRLCFVSSDPSAFYNPNATSLQPLADDSFTGTTKGQRNNTAFEIACDCRDTGKTPDEAVEAVLTFARSCTPPLPDHEARGCVRSAYSHPPRPQPRVVQLSVRGPDEILAMSFSDDDIILGDRIFAKGQPLVIAAQGGAGKSRLVMQMIACITAGLKFLEFNSNGQELRWLILQTENSNRRLQHDLTRLKSWLGDAWPKFAAQVVIHTIENDDDGFVSLDNPENIAAIGRLIEAHRPDVIVVDPLNEFAIGDLNKDADMRATLQALSRVCKRGNPERAIVVLHHSLTGKGGAIKATGYDRSSFARNSKTLHAWARGQINLVPVDPDNNERLIVACGKCSNGREFQTFAVKLDPETMIYSPDPSVDLAEWEADMTGKPTVANLSPNIVRNIVAEISKTEGAPNKKQIAKAIQDETGCARGSAYRAVDRAERAKQIHLSKTTKTYVAK